jgi:hypothetical protein
MSILRTTTPAGWKRRNGIGGGHGVAGDGGHLVDLEVPKFVRYASLGKLRPLPVGARIPEWWWTGMGERRFRRELVVMGEACDVYLAAWSAILRSLFWRVPPQLRREPSAPGRRG